MFNSFVRSLTRALRTLLEVTSLNMLLRHDARRARDDLLDVNLSLPFQTEVNTGFGVLAKVYLDALTHINGRQRVRDPNVEGVKEAKQMALDICEETFQGVKYPKAEVERGFRFWDVVSPIFPPLCHAPKQPLTTNGLSMCTCLCSCSLFASAPASPHYVGLRCHSVTLVIRQCASENFTAGWWCERADAVVVRHGGFRR